MICVIEPRILKVVHTKLTHMTNFTIYPYLKQCIVGRPQYLLIADLNAMMDFGNEQEHCGNENYLFEAMYCGEATVSSLIADLINAIYGNEQEHCGYENHLFSQISHTHPSTNLKLHY